MDHLYLSPAMKLRIHWSSWSVVRRQRDPINSHDDVLGKRNRKNQVKSVDFLIADHL